jgi:hypothetical protein
MMSLLAVALTAGLGSAPNAAFLELADREACGRLREALQGEQQEVAYVQAERGCSLRMPGVTAWTARPAEFSELLGLAGLDRARQEDLDAMMERLLREKPAEAHLLPAEGGALAQVQDAVDAFNRDLAVPTSCTCAWASLEESRGWVAWYVRPTGHCGNGLFKGDAPAWCPESDRFLPMLNGIAAVAAVVGGLIIRRWVRRRRGAAPTPA